MILKGSKKLHSDSMTTVEQGTVSVQKHLQALIQKAIPLSCLFGADIGSNFIKAYLMAKAGTDEFAALIIATNISYLVIYPFPELVGQNIVFIAEYFGKTRACIFTYQQDVPEDNHVETSDHMIGALVRQGWILSAIVSLPASALLMASPYFLLNLFNQTQRVNHLVVQFNFPVALSLSAEFINKMSEGFISAVDKEQWLLPYRASTMVVEIGLCFLLIPRYSLAGVAYASLGKSLFALVYLMIFFRSHAEFYQKFNIFHLNLREVNHLRKILNQSWPRFVTKMAGSFSTVGVTILIGQLPQGRIVLGSVVGHFYDLLSAINIGISEAANRIVAQYFGAKSYREMQRAGNISLVLNAGILGASTIAYNSMPLVLASQFLSKDEVQAFSDLLRWYFFLMGLANFSNVLMDHSGRILAAVQDTFLASLCSLLSTVALILPLTAIVVYLTKFDLYGVGGAIVLGTVPVALLTLSYWNKHSSAIVATHNTGVSSSNTNVENKFKLLFFRDKKTTQRPPDRATYRLLELSAASETTPHEDQNAVLNHVSIESLSRDRFWPSMAKIDSPTRPVFNPDRPASGTLP